MFRRSFLVLSLTLAVPGIAPIVRADPGVDARDAAGRWLALVDAGNYPDSWAQAGEYVVLSFETVFERKAAAVETVTLALEPDGRWRVVGYFVR